MGILVLVFKFSIYMCVCVDYEGREAMWGGTFYSACKPKKKTVNLIFQHFSSRVGSNSPSIRPTREIFDWNGRWIYNRTEVLLRNQQRNFKRKKKNWREKIGILLNKPIRDGQSPILGNSRSQVTSRVHKERITNIMPSLYSFPSLLYN